VDGKKMSLGEFDAVVLKKIGRIEKILDFFI